MKRLPIILVLVGVAGVSSTGCQADDAASSSQPPDRAVPFDVSAMQSVIEERNRVFTGAHVTGDSAAMVDIFTADARVLPPDADPVIGRRAIEVLTAEYLTFGITEFREVTTAFYGNQEMLIDEGTYVMVYDGGRTTEAGKYVNIWRREGNEWKIHSNIWNRNAPAVAGQ